MTTNATTTEEANAQFLAALRAWLANGAAIFATDVKLPILQIEPDGTCIANLTVDYKPTNARLQDTLDKVIAFINREMQMTATDPRVVELSHIIAQSLTDTVRPYPEICPDLRTELRKAHDMTVADLSQP